MADKEQDFPIMICPKCHKEWIISSDRQQEFTDRGHCSICEINDDWKPEEAEYTERKTKSTKKSKNKKVYHKKKS